MSLLEVLLVGGLAAAALVYVARFESMCLRDLAATSDEQLRVFTRQGWFALVIFLIPLGGMFYLCAGRGDD